MLLTIAYRGERASDLGFLLHKNPHRPQVFELNHGKAYVFYPELTERRAVCALLLSINPLDLARGKAGAGGGGLFDYVNDRPYVSSSFLSTAIAQVFGTAMTGRCDKRPELAQARLDLEAVVRMLPCRSGVSMLPRAFGPLGYEVSYQEFAVDERFPDWGTSRFVDLTIRGSVRLRDLLRHLYVLIPAFDRQKHYWIGEAEVEKLLRNGEDWLSAHPEREFIAQSYLGKRRALVNLALARLAELDDAQPEAQQDDESGKAEARPGLNRQRLEAVVRALKDCGAQRVIDLGCGEGKLMQLLIPDRQFREIAGVDVSHAALERAKDRLNLEGAGDALRERVTLMQGSLTYRDQRFKGYDAACVVEVIEHLGPPRLQAFERVLFGEARPERIVVTTPNREYNERYEALSPGKLRHPDHRFEWTRAEFRAWAGRVAEAHGYRVEHSEIGEADGSLGAPTQMGVFSRCE